MTKSDRFAILIIDLVIAFATGSATATVALLAGSVFGHPSPLLLALQCVVAVFVATAFACLLVQGANRRGDDDTME